MSACSCTTLCRAYTKRGSVPQNSNLSDSLMDRATLVDANLKNANLERVVFTRCAAVQAEPGCMQLNPAQSPRYTQAHFLPSYRSDLTGAKIDGADFSNALVDKTQQIVRLPHASRLHILASQNHITLLSQASKGRLLAPS